MNEQTGAVVVADGDEGARALAVRALRRAGYETIEVGSGVEALAAARREHVGLLALEVELPDMTGYEVCRDLRMDDGEDVPIFFLSTRTDPVDRVAGLLLGADDFIVKPFDASELVARVQRFVARRPRQAPAAEERRSSPASRTLTEREREVLDLLASGRKQKEIALDLSISAKTVATHIQNLLGKLGVHSRAELVASAYRQGLVSV